CILDDDLPFIIEQKHCLHCGNCLNVCPVGAVIRR
ncbi:MAG: 4Fe-4S binding protein, partial [bacterium]